MHYKTNHFGLLSLTILGILLNGCEPAESPCALVPNAYEYVLSCYVYDLATNKSLISNFGSPYLSQVSKLVNEKGEDVLISNPIYTSGKMEIPITIKGQDSIGLNISKVYYLHLVDELGIEKDIDTIRVSYKLYNANNCHRIDYMDFKCYFNDSLYLTEFPWDLYPGIIFYK